MASESPALWSTKRDKQLKKLRWHNPDTKTEYLLENSGTDSQVWYIKAATGDSTVVHGVLIVYVDDFLLQARLCQMRTAFLQSLGQIWTLAKEAVLQAGSPLTFLGIDLHLRDNGDIYLNQERFTNSLLTKYSMDACNSIKCVQMGPLPAELDAPSPVVLRQLQAYAGEFNWFATRIRPYISYYTPILASACSKQATWSMELVHKILRFLRGTTHTVAF